MNYVFTIMYMHNRKNDVLDKNTNLTNTYQISRFISIIIGIQGLSMSVVNLHEGNIPLMILSTFYGLMMLFSFFIISITKKLNFFYLSATFVCLVLEFNFIRTGGSEGFGMIWLLVIPVFAIFILSFKKYIILNLIILLVVAVCYWSPIMDYCYPVTKTFRGRYPWVYFLLFGFCSFIKYQIEKYETLLIKQKKLLESEISLASELQKGYFPQTVEIEDKWDLAFRNQPMAGVSGDFYDVYTTDGKLDGYGLFDISGHGVSSGLVSLLIKSIINYEFYNEKHSALYEKLSVINNRFILEKGNVPNYLTGILVRIKNNQLELVNAGHPYPIIYRKKTNTFEILEKDKNSIGVIGLDGLPTNYVSQFVYLESGDEIILYSDGVTDAKNKNGEEYGSDRFISSLNLHIKESAKEQIDAVYEDLKLFTEGAPACDDVTMMVLRTV